MFEHFWTSEFLNLRNILRYSLLCIDCWSRYRITDYVALESTYVDFTAVVRVQSDRTDAKTVGGAGRGGTGVRWILHHQWKRKAHSNAHHAKAPSSEFYLQLAYILYHHVMLSSPQPTTLNRPSWKARGPLYSEFGVQIRCLAPTGIGLVRIKATSVHCKLLTCLEDKFEIRCRWMSFTTWRMALPCFLSRTWKNSSSFLSSSSWK